MDGLMSRSTKPFDPNPELQDYSLEKVRKRHGPMAGMKVRWRGLMLHK